MKLQFLVQGLMTLAGLSAVMKVTGQSYVLNQYSSQQSGNMWLSGIGRADSSFISVGTSGGFIVETTNTSDRVNGSTWYGTGQSTADISDGNSIGAVQLAGFYGLRLRTANAIVDLHCGGGIYISGNNAFQYNGYNIWHAGNDGAGSGLDADLLQGYAGSTYIGQRGQQYYQANTWLQLNGGYGLYAPTIKDAHFTPNAISSYGQFAVYSNSGVTWGGLLLGNNMSAVHLMSNTGDYSGGFYYEDIDRWQVFFNKSGNYLSIGGTNNTATGSLYAGAAVFNGNVGIGTANPQSLLSVNGTISGKQVTVTQTGWSDFVFNKSYRLKPLSTVADYIARNNHLPDMPSAKEIECKGLDLGEMQQRQMQKIEELTLYAIDQDKRIQSQQQIIEQQNKRLKQQDKLIQGLEARMTALEKAMNK